MASFRDLLAATKAAIREVTTDQADELRKAPGALVLDIREPDEYEQGAIPGSMHIPRGTLETNIEMRLPDHSAPLSIATTSAMTCSSSDAMTGSSTGGLPHSSFSCPATSLPAKTS